MDFFQIRLKEGKKDEDPTEVYPEFIVRRSSDLMVQSGKFYAVWDEEEGLWSRDEYRVPMLVDKALKLKVESLASKTTGIAYVPSLLENNSTRRNKEFIDYVKTLGNNYYPLDTKVVFADEKVKKSDHASRRLAYSKAPGSIAAYEELVSMLYEREERTKFEWGIGSIIVGDSKKIEKFFVFHGLGGTGKSTVMKIIEMLFGGNVTDGGYVAMFEAQSLVGGNSAFGMEAFRANPLVGIQHDGDLSRIEDNSRLNSIVSHEMMTVNEKFKATYDSRINAMLFMGTNKQVQISDAKSGLIRRLIDIYPTGKTHTFERYRQLMEQIPFELGAIADHCVKVYKANGGRSGYKDYQPTKMMRATNTFLNFVEAHYDIFKDQDGTTVSQAWSLYKQYVLDAGLKYQISMIQMREQLQTYFKTFEERGTWEGETRRGIYREFNLRQFKTPIEPEKPSEFKLVLEHTESILDEMYSGATAQYAKRDGSSPRKYWTDDPRMINGEEKKPDPDQVVDTVLGDLDTKKLHFLKLPKHHIVIDFDLKDDDGNKSQDLNLKAASSFPATYAEFSKSGNGVHLHYFWDGDTDLLAPHMDDEPDIEIKVFRGNSSLRRCLTKCNDVAVATINSGLPIREKKPVLSIKQIRSEDALRKMIVKNMAREYHPGTKPSIDFIKKILDDAAESSLVFDVSDMRQAVMAFANNSEKNALYCLKVVTQMKWVGEGKGEESAPETPRGTPARKMDDSEDDIIFFDIEIYPNLFVIVWKKRGEGVSPVRMINPTSSQVAFLVEEAKLVGYNNRSYDNHMLMAAYHGASVAQLYNLSQRMIVHKDDSARYPSAWSLSYADVYDFATEKKTLKKWEIELGLRHMEMDIPWDQPVPEHMIPKVVEYCTNDVLALEAVFDHCSGDFQARKILASLSGKTVNDSTRQHAIKIMFGNDKNPQDSFVYTDLSETFPGYVFDQFSKSKEKSTYEGEVIGEGGLVYATPGIHKNVALLDVASMHPTSIIQLNLFGKYTPNFVKLVKARLAIKHAIGAWARGKDAEAEYYLNEARNLLPGIQVTKENAKALSDALKLVINSIYGYTCAKFDNPFRDKRNIDNIVAKRGALFMVLLRNFVQSLGFTVAHIKTDSIKIPDATPEIIEKVMEYGREYGYEFEHEATYDRMALVNNAVYVAHNPESSKNKGWSATGAEFQHPYVFKKLFTGEQIYFSDLCETKQVKEGAMYLCYPEGHKSYGKPKDELLKVHTLDGEIDPETEEPTGEYADHMDTFVGRSGSFVPVKQDNAEGIVGGKLLRVKDGKDYAVSGTKGSVWIESDVVRNLKGDEIDRMMYLAPEDVIEGVSSVSDFVDMDYFAKMADEAVKSIEKYGDFKEFVKG